MLGFNFSYTLLTKLSIGFNLLWLALGVIGDLFSGVTFLSGVII